MINLVSHVHSFLVRILLLTEHSRFCILRDERIRKIGCTCNGKIERDRVMLRVSRGEAIGLGDYWLLSEFAARAKTSRSCPSLYLRPIWQRAFNSARPCISRVLDRNCTVSRGLLSLLRHGRDFPLISGHRIGDAGNT